MDLVCWKTSASQLKAVSGILKDILTQVWILFDNEYIEILNVDPEKIVTIHFRVQPPASDYHCQSRHVFSIYAQTLYKVMRGISKDQTAQLSMSSPSCLYINMDESKNAVVLQTLQDSAPSFVCPFIAHNVVVDMETKHLHNILRDLSSISRHLIVELSEDKLTLMGNDAFGTISAFTIPTAYHKQTILKQTFILKYIERFCKASVSKNIKIYLREGYPIKFELSLDYGNLNLYMQPLE